MRGQRLTIVDKYVKCVQTLHELLRDRNYKISTVFDENESREKLRSLDLADPLNAQLMLNNHLIEGVQPTGDDIKVYWLCGKVGVNSPTFKTVRTTIAESSSNVSHVVLFVTFEGSSVSAPAKKDLASIPATIEFFDSTELQENITKHELQPNFKLLSDKESDDIKNMYGATNEQIPKLLWDDPVRRYFGARVNQILQSKRKAENGVEIM